MLVQSGGGKVYAVLANNDTYQLGLLPQVMLVSTTVMLNIRYRYQHLKKQNFDPTVLSKTLLVNGVEQSKDTARGTIALNTKIDISKIGKNFGLITAKMIRDNASSIFLGDDDFLTEDNLREDFDGDFDKLLKPQLEHIYPPKDFSSAPTFMTTFDVNLIAKEGAPSDETILSEIKGGKDDDGPANVANVVKVSFNNSDEDEKASETDEETSDH